MVSYNPPSEFFPLSVPSCFFLEDVEFRATLFRYIFVILSWYFIALGMSAVWSIGAKLVYNTSESVAKIMVMLRLAGVNRMSED